MKKDLLEIKDAANVCAVFGKMDTVTISLTHQNKTISDVKVCAKHLNNESTMKETWLRLTNNISIL